MNQSHIVTRFAFFPFLVAASLVLSGCGGKDGPAQPPADSLIGTWDCESILETQYGGDSHRRYESEEWYQFNADHTGQCHFDDYPGADEVAPFTWSGSESSVHLAFVGMSWEEQYEYHFSDGKLALERDFYGKERWHQVKTYTRR